MLPLILKAVQIIFFTLGESYFKNQEIGGLILHRGHFWGYLNEKGETIKEALKKKFELTS